MWLLEVEGGGNWRMGFKRYPKSPVKRQISTGDVSYNMTVIVNATM